MDATPVAVKRGRRKTRDKYGERQGPVFLPTYFLVQYNRAVRQYAAACMRYVAHVYPLLVAGRAAFLSLLAALHRPARSLRRPVVRFARDSSCPVTSSRQKGRNVHR